MSGRPSEVSDREAERAHRALRGVWLLVSAFHRDAVADEVAEMGARLRGAIDRGDGREAAAIIREVRSWLATRTGVVASRMCQVFELDDERSE